MGSKKQRQRKHRQRVQHGPGRTQQILRSVLPDGAPTALPLREMWADPKFVEARAEIHDRVMAAIPYFADVETGEPVEGVIDASEAWDTLDQIHAALTDGVARVAEVRGSAEWLWWLRRLQGQFEDVNEMPTTGPYVQATAEALAAGKSRPSTPIPDVPTFTFDFDDSILPDLMWLREVSVAIYQLHATMKRCAKGEDVDFIAGGIPRWDPDDDLDDAIEDYDDRNAKEGANLLRAIGLGAPSTPDLGSGQFRLAGLVPTWHHVAVGRQLPFAKSDPLPTKVEFIDLDAITPFRDQALLTSEHVALIAALWAGWFIATDDPDDVDRRMSAPKQWGYMVSPTATNVVPALERFAEMLPDYPGAAVDGCWQPGNADEILDVLAGIEPSVWPPLCGNPIHEAGKASVIDLTGATHRLLTTLVRPTDGTNVNYFSFHFEADVQAVVDETSWRPPVHCGD